MVKHLSDEFYDPACFDIFKDPGPLPEFLSYDDFMIYHTRISDRGTMPMPVLDENGHFNGDFEMITSTVFDERPVSRLSEIRNGKYVDVHGIKWALPNQHVRLSIWHPNLFYVGARYRPSILEAAEQTTQGWWWKFTITDPDKTHPLNHVQGGYVFAREDDAILFRVLLDILNR